MINRLTKSIFLKGLTGVRGGTLTLLADRSHVFGDRDGDLHGALAIASDRFFTRALADADIGFGESYMDGEWTSPDLVALIRLMLRNMALVEDSGGPVRAVNSAIRLIARRLRDNSVTGSRQHIRQHYDLGNDFFRLFLDAKHMMYSCAFYRTPHDTLEKAQEQKLDQIARKLDLSETITCSRSAPAGAASPSGRRRALAAGSRRRRSARRSTGTPRTGSIAPASTRAFRCCSRITAR
jgi:cyclopropane-fatty-acyl-phospholipid synthase